MSNRRRVRPPSRRDAAVDALVAGAQCVSCGSTKVLRRWRHGGWELTPLHRESCATRAVNGRTASPHQVSETSVAAARAAGFGVVYIPHSDASGGVVVDAEAALS
jgi:ssDNA-binding Zn-finger/Zn-ribbon topoisomerase 1